MEITESKTADIVTLCVSGKLDTTTAKTFEQKILDEIESGERQLGPSRPSPRGQETP